MNKNDYNKINNSNKNTLIFHFGAGAGFFSEYNVMLKAIAFCLINKIKFVLYSEDATFALKNGWTDYFEPFTTEVNDSFHSKLNHRFPIQFQPYINNVNYRQTIFFKRWISGFFATMKNFNSKYLIKYYPFIRKSADIKLVKKIHKFNYFTYDLWCDFYFGLDLNKQIAITHLYKGTINGLITEIDNMIWEFNLKTKNIIASHTSKISISTDFIGFHIRRGDKCTEAKLFEIEHYIENAINYTDIRKVFVASDDISAINDLRHKFKEWEFFTLEDDFNKGYNQDEFSNKDSIAKYNEITSFLSSIELLKKSRFFIGTQSSNIGQYLKNKFEDHHFISLD